MGFSQNHAACAVRISSGHATTAQDFEMFSQSWLSLIQKTNHLQKVA
jgi:cysteine sulfinate desulfinase/cysteine desulfurase-like protein